MHRKGELAPATINKLPQTMRTILDRAVALKTAGNLADAFRYLALKLYRAGTIRAVYSVHDLRHAFAVRLYARTRDINAVSRALHHATVDVTARCLRSMGLADLGQQQERV